MIYTNIKKDVNEVQVNSNQVSNTNNLSSLEVQNSRKVFYQANQLKIKEKLKQSDFIENKTEKSLNDICIDLNLNIKFTVQGIQVIFFFFVYF